MNETITKHLLAQAAKQFIEFGESAASSIANMQGEDAMREEMAYLLLDLIEEACDTISRHAGSELQKRDQLHSLLNLMTSDH